MNILESVSSKFKSVDDEGISIEEYLDLCKKDPSVYASPFERMLEAIGEPELVDTSKDSRLSRIFGNSIIKRFKVFEDFYGLEPVIEQIVSYFKHAAQGLEEAKQILYLLGPVGSAKSSLANRLRQLMESKSFYAIKGSPVHESPLGLFNRFEHGKILEKEFGIPEARLIYVPSPWLTKRLKESNGDLSKIRVVKLTPSFTNQIAISKTEPGDENNQDISALVGKVDIRKIELFSQHDPDAYGFNGGLCLSNRGLLEFVEMFKAPIKVLHPLLTATQDRMFNGTEAMAAIPFEGVILAHSNESEWQSFRNDKKNEAFIDRVYIVKVPYCLRVNEEVEIYKKLIRESNLRDSPCAPKTLELLATFSVLSRLKMASNHDPVIKMRVYNGENVKEKANAALSLQEYKAQAGVDEGMSGCSTRFAFKILSSTYNYDTEEVSANPVHLFNVLENSIRQEQLEPSRQDILLSIIKAELKKTYDADLKKDIITAYVNSDEFGQNVFDKYINLARAYTQDSDYRDPDTGIIFDRQKIDNELSKVEEDAHISSRDSFREKCVNFCLDYMLSHGGKNPPWTSYEPMRSAIEKRLIKNLEDIVPIISIDAHKNEEDKRKYNNFFNNMKKLGYTTKKMIKIVVQYYVGIANQKG